MTCHSPGVPTRSPLLRFLFLYSALFAAFGAASPFLPGLLLQDGLDPTDIGIVLASGTAIRLLAGPLGGWLADRWRPSAVLAAFTAAAAMIALGYGPARGLALLLAVGGAHAAVLAPINPIADALAVSAADGKPGFDYGWVRGAGSAAFILGTLVAGQCVGWSGLGSIVWLNAGLLAVAAVCAWRVPDRLAAMHVAYRPPAAAGALRALLAIPTFNRLMLVAALIGGSHALHDGFEVIRWRAAGMTAAEASVLWTTAVAAEVVVFFFLGRPMLDRLGPGRATMLCALAGVVRWSIAAQTAWFPVMAMIEPLHGLTFALLHLACMDLLGQVVPARLAATAQAVYGTVAIGATSVAVTLAAGPLYGHLGAAAFWVMAAMCAAALPVARGIRTPPM